MLLVTGITGHSGRYFLDELIKHNYKESIRCVVLDEKEISLFDSSGLNVEIIVGDLCNQEFVDRAMVGVDTVMHIASIFYSVNIIRSAVKNNVRRAILLHTTGIYSKYKSASEEYKSIELNIKKICKNSNSSIGITYLRPTMIYGNINDKNLAVFIKMVDKIRLFPIVDHGKNLLQPVNGRDLGKAYYQLLNKPDIMSGDYILSGNKPITMLDMFKLISDNLGKKTTFINVPLGLGVFMAICLRIFTLGKVDYIEKVQRMGEDRSFPHENARLDFGYKPMPFEEGLKIEIDQYLKSSNKAAGV